MKKLIILLFLFSLSASAEKNVVNGKNESGTGGAAYVVTTSNPSIVGSIDGITLYRFIDQLNGTTVYFTKNGVVKTK